MKKFRRLAVLAGLAGLMAMPAAAADVSYTTVLSGSVVSVALSVQPSKGRCPAYGEFPGRSDAGCPF